MKTLYRQLTKSYLSISFSQTRAVIGLILLAIILLVGMRACSKYFIYERQEYRVARGTIWYPGEMSSREKSMQGFEDDLLQAIARHAEVQIHLFSEEGDLLSQLKKHVYDGVLTAQVATLIQSNQYLFSNIFFYFGPKLVVRQASNVHSLSDLNGKAVGVFSGASVSFGLQYPAIEFKTYDNIVDAISDLDQHIIEGVIIDLWTAQSSTAGFYLGKLKVVPVTLSLEGLRLATLNNPESKEFIDLFNKSLEALHKDGTYDKLLQKWSLK